MVFVLKIINQSRKQQPEMSLLTTLLYFESGNMPTIKYYDPEIRTKLWAPLVGLSPQYSLLPSGAPRYQFSNFPFLVTKEKTHPLCLLFELMDASANPNVKPVAIQLLSCTCFVTNTVSVALTQRLIGRLYAVDGTKSASISRLTVTSSNTSFEHTFYDVKFWGDFIDSSASHVQLERAARGRVLAFLGWVDLDISKCYMVLLYEILMKAQFGLDKPGFKLLQAIADGDRSAYEEIVDQLFQDPHVDRAAKLGKVKELFNRTLSCGSYSHWLELTAREFPLASRGMPLLYSQFSDLMRLVHENILRVYRTAKDASGRQIHTAFLKWLEKKAHKLKDHEGLSGDALIKARLMHYTFSVLEMETVRCALNFLVDNGHIANDDWHYYYDGFACKLKHIEDSEHVIDAMNADMRAKMGFSRLRFVMKPIVMNPDDPGVTFVREHASAIWPLLADLDRKLFDVETPDPPNIVAIRGKIRDLQYVGCDLEMLEGVRIELMAAQNALAAASAIRRCRYETLWVVVAAQSGRERRWATNTWRGLKQVIPQPVFFLSNPAIGDGHVAKKARK